MERKHFQLVTNRRQLAAFACTFQKVATFVIKLESKVELLTADSDFSPIVLEALLRQMMCNEIPHLRCVGGRWFAHTCFAKGMCAARMRSGGLWGRVILHIV